MAAEIIAVGAGVVQAVSQVYQAFFNPCRATLSDNVKATLPDNVEGIIDILNYEFLLLVSIMKDFENEVERDQVRVPSRMYVEWSKRVTDINCRYGILGAEYNQYKGRKRTSFQFRSPSLDFKEEMKKMYNTVINLLQESKEIRENMLINRGPERATKRKGPDIRKFETLRKPLEKILDWLNKNNIKGIGIYGTVGIGKTTVMLNLNNDDQVAKMFDIVIWLKVSNEGGEVNLEREHIQHAIVQTLKLTMAGTNSADEVAQRISTELKGKKYLLLLDDVKKSLDLSKIGIPDNNIGSKIVLTTRSRTVCKSMKVNAIKVSYLSPDEAWEMFQDVLESKTLLEDTRIGGIAWQVCQECYGLPLLIEKVANTFKLKNTPTLWSCGLNSWRKWPEKECNGIREIYELLRFCYNDLGEDRYKKCFLYGALYPEDSDINIDSLLQCWAVEDHLGGAVPVMDGELILNHLKNVSLLEKSKSDYHVTMHKFIRQVALYISEDNPECKYLVETNKKLRKPPNEESWGEKNRISLGDNELERLPASPLNCSMLSTLFLQKNQGLKDIPPSFFVHMENLRVLDLSHTGIVSLPLSLSRLARLRVLHLNNCEQFVKFPSDILERLLLESLDIRGIGINYKLLRIEKLKHLKHLWVSFENGNDTQGDSLNDVISNISTLEELVIDLKPSNQWTNEVADNIMDVMKEVATLKEFKRLKICFSNRVVDVIEVTSTTVRILVPEARFLLYYIKNSWKVVNKIESFRFFIGCPNSEYRQNSDFTRYEKYVQYCNGAGSNSQFLEVLAEAQGFELVNHKVIKQLSEFEAANMNKIQGCLIEGCDAIETIIDHMGSELLPNLERLFAKNLPMLKSIWKEGPLSQTKLTTLVLSNCRNLENIFPSNTNYDFLVIKYLKVEKCEKITEIIPKADTNGNLPVLQKLKQLVLLGMTNLNSICAVESLKGLETLEIFACPNLCSLPWNKLNSANLKCIEVEKWWWGELEWENQEDEEELQKLCNFSSRNNAAP